MQNESYYSNFNENRRILQFYYSTFYSVVNLDKRIILERFKNQPFFKKSIPLYKIYRVVILFNA